MPKTGHWYALAGAIVGLDQLSKWLVLENLRFGETIYVAPFWNWVLTFNPGAAFSFLADQPGWQRWLFTFLALIGFERLPLRRFERFEAGMLGVLFLVLGVVAMFVRHDHGDGHDHDHDHHGHDHSYHRNGVLVVVGPDHASAAQGRCGSRGSA